MRNHRNKPEGGWPCAIRPPDIIMISTELYGAKKITLRRLSLFII